MELRQFGPDDTAALRDCVAVCNASRAVEAPWQHRLTEARMASHFRYGWDLEPSMPFLAIADGDVVGCATCRVSDRDNLHLAWFSLDIHPDHRGRGHGTAALEALMAHALELGRTSVGLAGWDRPTTRAFSDRHGFTLGMVSLNRRQILADVDWEDVTRRRDQAGALAGDYELVRRTGPSPDEELPDLAKMAAAINDAPTDDLDIEAEVYTPERVRDYETAQLGQSGDGFHRVYARHAATGELAGQTVVVVQADLPAHAEQHDTSVVQAHRGHRLGLLLKAEMMLWLREAQPQLETVDTWNAESNDFMIGVNELLGYRIMGRELAFQKTV